MSEKSDIESNLQQKSMVKSKAADSADVHDLGWNETRPGQTEDISATYWGAFGRISKRLESLGFESRGIQRVLSEECTRQSFWGLTLIWASAALGLGTFSIGFIGPLFFNLSLRLTLAVTWGVGALGSFTAAYLAIFGKRHGLRQLVHSRYSLGWYGAMVAAFLNIATEGIFSISNAILGGQTLFTMSNGKLSVSGGLAILCIISWILATAGFRYISMYERYAWILPAIAFISMAAVGGTNFSTEAAPNPLDKETQIGLGLSYGALIFGAYSGWIPMSADYYIYFPVETADWKICLISFLGIFVLPSFGISIGAAFGSATLVNADYSKAYFTNGSVPDLIEYVLRPLGNVRYFFLFVLAFAVVSSNVFNLYSISISMQVFGKHAVKIPRYIYSAIAIIVIIVISIAGQDNVAAILSNLVAVIAYWTIIYFVIVAEEHLIFRRKSGYNLDVYNHKHFLPLGLAAGLAFGFGAAGAIVGMSQSWYTGPIAKMVGDKGADLGTELAFLFTLLTYPLFRYLELNKYGR